MAVQISDSLRRRRSIVLLSTALAGSALAVAGCGGTSQTGASPSETASYVPAGSPFYLEATTEFDGPQWTQVDTLAKLFPAYPELRAELNDSLRSDKVNFETDVRPLLGARAAIAGLALPNTKALQGTLTSPGADAAGGAAAATAAADDTPFVGGRGDRRRQVRRGRRPSWSRPAPRRPASTTARTTTPTRTARSRP